MFKSDKAYDHRLDNSCMYLFAIFIGSLGDTILLKLDEIQDQNENSVT